MGPGHFQTVCDDKSGYDHICLSPSSRTLFGLSWKGLYFVFNTVSFGLKSSAYVYHSTGSLATSYITFWACPARNTSTIAMQASSWCAGNQPLQFSLILNWPKPLLLFSFQFSLHWVTRSRCQNRLLYHPSASVSWVTFRILF